MIDIHHKLIEIDSTTGQENVTEYPMLSKFDCGKIPIMLKSDFCVLSEQSNFTSKEMGECEYDNGGYFIIKGGEKVIVCQERKCENKVFGFKQKSSQTKYSHEVEISSVNPTSPSFVLNTSVKLTAKELKYGKAIRVNIKTVKVDVPLFILFRAFGILSDKKIVEMIVYDLDNNVNKKFIDILKGSIEEASSIQTKELALAYISKNISTVRTNNFQTSENKLKYTENKIMQMFLPHLGDSLTKKAYFLGYMVNKLLRVYFGIIPPDDRDSFLNKKVESSGELMSQLFRANFSKFVKDMKSSLDKDVRIGKIEDCHKNLAKKFKPNEIAGGINWALSTGTWGAKSQARQPRKGVAQVLQRLNYLGCISNLRRIVAPLDRNGKQTEVRKLHSSQYGTICPFESPEGGSVGIVKNMALMCHITIPSNAMPVLYCLEEFGIMPLETVQPISIAYTVKVFVNGDWIGQTDKPYEITTKLKKMRRCGLINIYTSIAWSVHKNELRIRTDGGRLCRPLYIVNDNKLLLTQKKIDEIREKELTWQDLLIRNSVDDISTCNLCEKVNELDETNCFIEYIDTDEADTCMIAMTYDNLLKNNDKNDSYYNYTHCEMHPSMMFGVLVTNIPFADHNQAPRNIFQGAMGKQAIGIYNTAYRNRFDTAGHILHYPQKPICNTLPSKFVHSHEIPCGMNCIVAIACYTGYNQEDSLMYNRTSISRGIMGTDYYRTYKDEEKKNQSSLVDEIFMIPQKFYPNGKCMTEKMGSGSYDKLGPDGFAKEGTYIEGGDYIIGKVIPLKNVEENGCKYRDSSKALRSNESGIVDKVYVNRNGDGYRFVKMRIMSRCIPEIGDKFASQHGQKGTIGITYNQEDMPFTKDGVVPDVIMNPNALPKRMTIGHVIECAFSKMSCLKGIEFDATPFRKTRIQGAAEILESLDFKRSGKEVLYNGKTGEQIKADIFIGPTFYYRLKHLVKDKMHSRSSGPYQLLTRQPAEGRSKDGGLRFGEMERDCMISHGTVQFLKERIFDCSDKFFVWIDKDTGMISPVNPAKNIYKSLYSNNTTRFAKIQIPYASKLMIQELMAMHIVPRIKTDGL
jgi:DNA-directed RNA polymerase II subunit RPB2